MGIRSVVTVAVTVLLIKAVFLAVLFLGWFFLPPAAYPGQDIWMVRPGTSFRANLSNFDGAWHWRIAQVGYARLFTGEYDTRATESTLPVWDERGRREGRVGFAFRQFPFLGTLLRVPVLRTQEPLVWGVVVVCCAAIAAAVLIYQMTAREWGEEAGRWAAVMTAVIPGGVFLTAVYAEAFNVLFVAAALYAARTRRWRLAGLAAVLAVTTRVEAVLVLGALAVEWWDQRRQAGGKMFASGAPAPSVATLIGVVAPAAAVYVGILGWFWALSGEPFINARLIRGYGEVAFPAWPWDIVAQAMQRPEARVRDLPMAAATCLVLVFGWRAMPVSYRAYWLAMQVLILSGSMQSYIRHCLLMVPMFPALGFIVSRHPMMGRGVAVASALACSLFGVLYINGYWVG